MPCGSGYRSGSRAELNPFELWQNIVAWVKSLVVKVHNVDAHSHKSWATEECQNNQQVDEVAKTEVVLVILHWKHECLISSSWGP